MNSKVKWAVSALIASVFVFFVLQIEVETIEVKSEVPVKPAGIPESAFWVGGIDGGDFIEINETDKSNKGLYYVRVYNDYTGEIEYDGEMKYSNSLDISGKINNPENYQGWDGDKIILNDMTYLQVYEK